MGDNEKINVESKAAANTNNSNITKNKSTIKHALKDQNDRKRKSSEGLNRLHKSSKKRGLNLLKNSTKLECNICGINFTRKASLKRHIQSIHKQNSRFTCDLCTFSTNRWDSVISHKKNFHKIK